MIYLACPYSHPDPTVRQRRFEVATQVAAKLMQQGKHVFSPLSHSHPIALAGGLPLSWDYWEAYDRVMLAACSEVYVLQWLYQIVDRNGVVLGYHDEASYERYRTMFCATPEEALARTTTRDAAWDAVVMAAAADDEALARAAAREVAG